MPSASQIAPLTFGAGVGAVVVVVGPVFGVSAWAVPASPMNTEPVTASAAAMSDFMIGSPS
jgi:hypothetical protein